MIYSPDPNTADTPLNAHEVEQLLDSRGKGLSKSRAAMHLLGRVRATLRQHRDQVASLHREVQRTQLNHAHAGQATTLHPLDSFRYLSPDEQKSVMDDFLQRKYDALMAELVRARETTQEARRLANGLRFQMASVLEDPSVPERIRDQVRGLLVEVDDLDDVEVPDHAEPAPSPARPQDVPAARTPTDPDAGGGSAAAPAPADDDDLDFDSWLNE